MKRKTAESEFFDLDPAAKRKIELAAEDIVIEYETSHGWECERVGHLKIGFDIRSLAPADPQTGYRDTVTGKPTTPPPGRPLIKEGSIGGDGIFSWYC